MAGLSLLLNSGIQNNDALVLFTHHTTEMLYLVTAR